MRIVAIVSLLLLSLSATAAPKQKTQKHEPASQQQEQPAAPAPIKAEALSAHVKILASDEFEGRAPGTQGEEKATAYIAEQMKKAGLQPAGPNGSWFQEVPFIETRIDERAKLQVTTTRDTTQFEPRRDFVLWSMRTTPPSAIVNSQLVFVGYGIAAPERNWDDFRGVDLRGKTIVVLVNDPGSANPALFDGNAMTYYGRWTYKFEEAARRGAIGALLVHETRTASYPWSVVQSSWSGPRFDIPIEGADTRPAAEGWITTGMAQLLFRIAGQDFDSLKAAAARPGFRAVPLDARVSIDLKPQRRSFTSKNVVGILRGAERPDETLLFTAHWDHFGKGKDGEIYYGALDNASGVAGMLALADKFAHDRKKPARSLLFAAVTGEEFGLLGSAWYAKHPLKPLATTVANLNLDVLASIGPTSDVIVTGAGKVPDLEAILGRYAAKQERRVEPDAHPETGGFFRSDQFNLAKAGVPVLAARSGSDSREHGKAWGEAQRQDYTANRYHRSTDAWSPDIDWRGAVQDLELYYAVARELADGKDWPRWSEKAEFARVRAETDAQRGIAPKQEAPKPGEPKAPDAAADAKPSEKAPERPAPVPPPPAQATTPRPALPAKPEPPAPESKAPAPQPLVPNSPLPD